VQGVVTTYFRLLSGDNIVIVQTRAVGLFLLAAELGSIIFCSRFAGNGTDATNIDLDHVDSGRTVKKVKPYRLDSVELLAQQVHRRYPILTVHGTEQPAFGHHRCDELVGISGDGLEWERAKAWRKV
jgi:hypothetical protein